MSARWTMDDIGIDIDYGGNEYVRIRMGGGVRKMRVRDNG